MNKLIVSFKRNDGVRVWNMVSSVKRFKELWSWFNNRWVWCNVMVVDENNRVVDEYVWYKLLGWKKIS